MEERQIPQPIPPHELADAILTAKDSTPYKARVLHSRDFFTGDPLLPSIIKGVTISRWRDDRIGTVVNVKVDGYQMDYQFEGPRLYLVSDTGAKIEAGGDHLKKVNGFLVNIAKAEGIPTLA